MKHLKHMQLLLLALGACVFLAFSYSASWRAPLFTVDDDSLIDVPYISGPLSHQNLQSVFTPGSGPDFYPLRDLSYIADFRILGPSVTGLRVHQFLLFCELAILFFFLLRRFGISAEVAAGAVLLWACHPFHAEMLCWISARKDLLALVYGAYALLAFLHGASRDSRRWMGLGSFFFLLSLLSKASLTALPFVGALAALAGYRPLRRRSSLVFLGALCLLSISSGFFSSWYYSNINDMKGVYSLDYRLLASATALGRMMTGLLDNSVNIVETANGSGWVERNGSFLFAGAGLWISILAAFATGLAIRKRPLLLLTATFLALYLPVSGLLFPHKNFYSVRYAEPLFAVLIVALALAVDPWARKLQGQMLGVAKAFVAVAICVFASASFSEARLWAAPIQVLSKGLTSQPKSIHLRVISLMELSRMKRESPDNPTLRKASTDLQTQLDTYCFPPKPERGEECLNYWVYTLQEVPREKTALRNELVRLIRHEVETHTTSAVLPRMQSMINSVFTGAFDREEAQGWLALQHPSTDVTQRLLDWTALCIVKDAEAARAYISRKIDRGLVAASALNRYQSAYLHPKYAPLVAPCLPVDFATLRADPASLQAVPRGP